MTFSLTISKLQIQWVFTTLRYLSQICCLARTHFEFSQIFKKKKKTKFLPNLLLKCTFCHVKHSVWQLLPFSSPEVSLFLKSFLLFDCLRAIHTSSHSLQHFSSVSQCNPFTGRLCIPSPSMQPSIWPGCTISAFKIKFLQHEENASGYPTLPLFHIMNLKESFPLRQTYAKHLSIHCHIAHFALFLLILPASQSKDSLWVVSSATGNTTRSQVHDHGSEGLLEQIIALLCLFMKS